jgi:hypothetical protein
MSTERKTFNVFKGLQKPLVFKAFKGKFIYWGVGSVIGAVVIGGLTMAFVGSVIGGLVMVAILVGGFLFTATNQKKGLYTKTKSNGIHIIASVYENGKTQRI